MKSMFDVIIIGSGLVGVQAAYPLLEAGLKVAIIDAGLDSKKQDRRTKNTNQLPTKSNASRLLKKSSYVFNKTYELLPIKSNIEIIQSLAKGGLSELWPGMCDVFTKSELTSMGLPPKHIQKEYQQIASRIEIIKQPTLHYHSEIVLQKASKLTSHDLHRLSIAPSCHASTTIQELKKFKNFTYFPNQLIHKVKDQDDFVEVTGSSIDTKINRSTKSRYVIMAAGSINTTRILLRSFNLYNYKTPFLTKDSYMFVCLHTSVFGVNKKQKGPGQVSITDKKLTRGMRGYFIQFYPCNPEALQKSAPYIPLPKWIFSTIAQFLVVADVRFPTIASSHSFSRLIKQESGQDILEISFKKTEQEQKKRTIQIKKISKFFKSMNLLPLKMVYSDVTSHYAGGIPIQNRREKLSVNAQGKLHQAKRIYVADSSSWKTLPASPPTFTMMANASRVAKHMLRNFR